MSKVHESQMTMADEEVFKEKPFSKKGDKSLPHDDFVQSFNSKQRATYNIGPKLAKLDRTSISSKDSNFDVLMQSLPPPKENDLKSKIPDAAKEKVKSPKLFDDYDYGMEDDVATSKKTNNKVSKPQKGNKLNLTVQKSVAARKVNNQKIIFGIICTYVIVLLICYALQTADKRISAKTETVKMIASKVLEPSKREPFIVVLN
jgi:hypothetical protein